MSGAPNNNWSLKRRLLGRVVIGVGLGWLLGLGIGLWIIAHEMGELLDESLKDSHISQRRFIRRPAARVCTRST